jgi:hypothetical protein
MSTGVVTFTITFLEKFMPHGEGSVSSAIQSLHSWGVWSRNSRLFVDADGDHRDLDLARPQVNGWTASDSQKAAVQGTGGKIQAPAFLMLGAFLAAIVAMIWAGICLAKRSNCRENISGQPKGVRGRSLYFIFIISASVDL